ncbi:MAG: hypothetical protein JWQ10_2405 [Herbaspirillum sp.]|nr:hypothetical protein [Herbaspirillum sp.]
MEIACSAAAVPGSFTQWRFDTAPEAQNKTPSIYTRGAEHAPAPDNIQSMQLAGLAWSRRISTERYIPQPTKARFCESHESHEGPESPPHVAANLAARPRSEPFPIYLHLQTLQRSCRQLSRQMTAAGSNREPQQKYKNALIAIDRLIKSINRYAKHGLPNTGPSNADAGGGVIAVDLDEAIHGLYTAIAYTKNASANGFGSIGESLTQEANLWAHDPMTWLTQSAMPHGGADVSLAAIVTVALVPFALMALHAGISEMRESKRHGKALDVELGYTRTFLTTLKQISTSASAASNGGKSSGAALPPRLQHMVDAAGSVCAQQLDDLILAQQKNRENGQIGACSAMSGGAIAVKATLDLTSKVGYLALAGNAAGTVLATTAGAASAILAPIAAVSAVGLGARMVLKSNQALKDFNAACARLKSRLNTPTPLLPPSRTQSGVNEYLQFLPKKLDQRTKFLRNYAEKNRRFLFGSVLYAASALTTFGLTGAALLGAGVVLGPIGLGVLVAVGITGGLLMGRYSTQFLFGHGRQHRYESYSIGDDPEVDRHFLGSIDTFTRGTPGIANTTGLKLRAAFYEQASRREELRQDFLTDVANDLEKRYDGMHSYSTDSEAVRQKRDGAPTKWKTARAQVLKKYESTVGHLRAGASYLATLLKTRDHAEAKTEAGQLRRAAKPYLSVDSLHDWLEQPKNYPVQLKLMHSCLSAQTIYLQEKTHTRLKMYALSNEIIQPPADASTARTATVTMAGDDVSTQNHDVAQELNILLDQLAAPLIRDVHLLDQTEILQKQLRQYQTGKSALPDEPALAAITSRFLSLQSGQPYGPEANLLDIRQSQYRLARFYLKEAPGRYRNLRGLLMDAELQATRLAQRDAAKTV